MDCIGSLTVLSLVAAAAFNTCVEVTRRNRVAIGIPSQNGSFDALNDL
ncbi:MAG: hypothetical protein ABSD59_18990 [Terracidiphilus sp.]|jgi:hypothetical protein